MQMEREQMVTTNTGETTMQTPPVKQQSKGNRKLKRTLFLIGMLAPPILQFLIFFVYVNFNTVLMSFQFRTLESVTWGFGNYVRFFNELGLGRIGNAVKNSVLIGMNDFLLLTISVVFSYFFYKKIRGAGVFRIIFFLPSIISIVIFVMAFKYMFDPKMGIVNYIWEFISGEAAPEWFATTSEYQLPLIMIYCLWVGTGYNILIMGGAMANLPEEVMEYSRLEGVSYFRELFQIVIPMIWPTVSVGILGAFTTMFTMFLQVELLTGGGTFHQSTTIAYLINGIVKGGTDLEWAATLGVCFTVVAIPIIIIVRKSLEKIGDALGA